jgi:hypothetical protein
MTQALHHRSKSLEGPSNQLSRSSNPTEDEKKEREMKCPE